MTRRTNRLTVLAFVAAIALGACRSQEDPQIERPVEDLYNIAVNSPLTENMPLPRGSSTRSNASIPTPCGRRARS